MATTTTDRRIDLARQGKLTDLFIEELGWDRLSGPALPITIPAPKGDGEAATFTLRPVAEKRGVQVYACDPDSDGVLPADRQRRALDRALAKRAFEHLIVFHDDGWTHQIWQWTDNEPGSARRQRTIELRPGATGEQLRQALGKIAFDVGDEDALTLLDVIKRLKDAVPPDRVTRRFYDQFSKERVAFEGFIEGITAQGDRDWYASLMLNRLMFVYFIQQKGFLDNNRGYLQDRLRRVQAGELPVATDGSGFLTFYRAFLRHLFHDALAQPKAERELDPALARFMGNVPYLNGGLFDVHDIEAHGGIDIADEAFERLFAFFERFHWHLDDRPLHDDREINPDVLGYIFEKFINQKEMGAYYTKEDITGYICQNTVLPWVLDAARRECAVAFRPEEAGNVWELLRDDPDRYLYPAVRKGVIDTDGAVIPLPAAIAAGVEDVTRRGGWNARADESFGLPTETWREHVHRRQRCLELRGKLAAGEIHAVDDLITWNLDIRQFAQDAIDRCEGPELLRALYKAIRDATVLDPTCGSGAFLFAALNVLFPLHDACLERMRGFLDDLAREPAHRPEKYRDFKEAIALVEQHPSQDYHVLRQIVLNNLYGVDIMPEAVEICKLRLFLKLVAQLDRPEQIEPLPDIDFNIRAGNTLVGFATHEQVRAAIRGEGKLQPRMDLFDEMAPIDERAGLADRAFKHFKDEQNKPDHDKADLRAAKRDYQKRLATLRDELDHVLAKQYGVDPSNTMSFREWRDSHRPFHWFVDFHHVMHGKGGMDVVIGNPPYAAMSKVRKRYTIIDFRTAICNDVYAPVVERAQSITNDSSYLGMIVPMSIAASKQMAPLRQILFETEHALWLSHYSGDANPSTMFDGVKYRLSILLSHRHGNRGRWCTGYNKWFHDERPVLFQLLGYQSFDSADTFLGLLPKYPNVHARTLTRKLQNLPALEGAMSEPGHPIYVHRVITMFIKCIDFTPFFRNEQEGQKRSDDYKEYLFSSAETALDAVAILNSNLFFQYFTIYGDCFHCGREFVRSFPANLEGMNECKRTNSAIASMELMDDLKRHSVRKRVLSKKTGIVEYDEFWPRESKSLIDGLDILLAPHFRMTAEELDFVIHHHEKYRTGRED